MEVAERFARDQGLATPERDGMLGALRELHDGLEATRDAIEAGRIHPSEGRREMAAVGARAEADLVEVLGSVRTEALRDALSELPGGGF